MSDIGYFTPFIFKVILAVMYFSGLCVCLLSVTHALDCWEICSNDQVVKSVSSTHFIAEEWKYVLTLLHVHLSAQTLEFLLQDEIVWIGIEFTLEICSFLTGHRVNKAISQRKGWDAKTIPVKVTFKGQCYLKTILKEPRVQNKHLCSPNSPG